MKNAFLKASLIVFFMLYLSTAFDPVLVYASDKEVTVTGQALITGGNTQVARNNALKDAFRQAVEKGLGVWINSQTDVDKNIVIKDKILTNSQGYVTNYEFVNEQQDGAIYYLTIRASVAVDTIGSDFKKLLLILKRQMDSPKIAFVLTTWDEDGNKKADRTITAAFMQEFREKGFDIKAADRADQIAGSLDSGSYYIRDRQMIREMAARDGANYVARGELKILDRVSTYSGVKVTVQVEAEIIDVNSGENIASYTNNFSALNAEAGVSQSNAVKKASVVAARQLAEQTVANWQERTQTGKSYTLELRNVISAGYQKLPFQKTLKGIVSDITSSYSPMQGVYAYDVFYSGTKDELGEAVLDALKEQPGFSRAEFDGPSDEGGKVIFSFK